MSRGSGDRPTDEAAQFLGHHERAPPESNFRRGLCNSACFHPIYQASKSRRMARSSDPDPEPQPVRPPARRLGLGAFDSPSSNAETTFSRRLRQEAGSGRAQQYLGVVDNRDALATVPKPATVSDH